MSMSDHPALFYAREANEFVRCHLCPHKCLIAPGKGGICRVRENHSGNLVATSYGRLSAVANDPVEKKPLYHFCPGEKVLSIGSYGCNFSCSFCQNHEISQTGIPGEAFCQKVKPEEVIALARLHKSIGVAFTYNEPVTQAEYVLDTAALSRQYDLSNVMVTNGYVSEKALSTLLPLMDAFNVDLKSVQDAFYKKMTGGRIQPVLDTLKTIYRAGCHLEITFLIVTGENDSEEEIRALAQWIAKHLGSEVPLHLSRYFPRYRSIAPATPEVILKNLYGIASGILEFVYTGNMDSGVTDTLCPGCGHKLIVRRGYSSCICGLDAKGYCLRCGRKGYFRLKETSPVS